MAQVVFHKKRVGQTGSYVPPTIGGFLRQPICQPKVSDINPVAVGLAPKLDRPEIRKLAKLMEISDENLPVLALKSVELTLMSTQDVRNLSVCHVESADLKGLNSINDPRMGPKEQDELCPTCGKGKSQCPGHFSHIELNAKIYHPLALREILRVLICVCNSYGKLLLTKDDLQAKGILRLAGYSRLQAIEGASEGAPCRCSNEKSGGKCMTNPVFNVQKTMETNKITYSTKAKSTKFMTYSVDLVYEIFDSISDEDATLLGFTEGMHPRNFILQVWPVIPPADRPPTEQEGEIWPDNLTTMYQNIVKANMKLKDPNLNEVDREKQIDGLALYIHQFIDNSGDKKLGQGDTKEFLGIKQRIQGKDALIRSALMGKRVNYSGRAVISPDPSLKFGQARIPESIAKVVTVPKTVITANKYSLQKLLRAGRVVHITPGPMSTMKNLRGHYVDANEKIRNEYVLQIGDVVHRWLQTGDMVILNRQPTLHKESWMAYEAVVFSPPYGESVNTIGIPLATTTLHNADFDGDEMNIHIPQDEEVASELLNLMNVRQCMMTSQTNKNGIGLVYNNLSAAYLMTDDSTRMELETFYDGLANITNKKDYSAPYMRMERDKEFMGVFDVNGLMTRLKKYKVPLLSGKALFSATLPNDFYYSHGEVLIKEGILIKGVITKDHIGPTPNSIVQQLFHQYSMERAADFVTDASFVLDHWLTTYGFSVGLADCRPPTRKIIDEKIKKEIENARLLIESLGTKLIDPLEEERRERQITATVKNVSNVAGRISKENLHRTNALNVMARSKAKGTEFNIAQITGLVGQQFLMGQRLKGQLPYYDEEENETLLEARGFVTNSFASGLTPAEFFFHSAASREGIAASATSVSLSGSLHHSIVKGCEDLLTAYDGSVRNVSGVVFQFLYGEDGFDASRLIRTDVEGQTVLFFIDLKTEFDKLNTNYGY